METITSRVTKVFTGACLIVVPLIVDSASLGYGILLPLMGLPVIFSGMFDWRPAEVTLAWIARTVKLPSDDIKFTPNNAL
jgi:hypothetical protein